MTDVEFRLDALIELYKNRIIQTQHLIELNKSVLTRELNENHHQQMFTQGRKIEMYDFEIQMMEIFVESLEFARTGEMKK